SSYLSHGNNRFATSSATDSTSRCTTITHPVVLDPGLFRLLRPFTAATFLRFFHVATLLVFSFHNNSCLEFFLYLIFFGHRLLERPVLVLAGTTMVVKLPSNCKRKETGGRFEI